jgi:hypothetical protein
MAGLAGEPHWLSCGTDEGLVGYDDGWQLD